MASRRKTDKAPWSWVIPAVLAACCLLLYLGVTTPVLVTDRLGSAPHGYSIIGGVRNLFAHGETSLGVLVLAFSVVFPPAKLLVMTWLWFWRLDREMQHSALWVLHFLGKWSMLDVFVVAVMATAADLGILSQWTVRSGVLIFACAIALSMLLSYIIMWRLSALPPIRRSRELPGRLLPLLVVEWLAAAGALALPVMKMGKWVFWENSYTTLGGVFALIRGEAPRLGVTVFVFVIALPAVSLLGWTGVWVWSRIRILPGGLRYLLILDEWAMIDVFGLAVGVVMVQAAENLEVHARPGLYMLAVWALVFIVRTTWIWGMLRVDDS